MAGGVFSRLFGSTSDDAGHDAAPDLDGGAGNSDLASVRAEAAQGRPASARPARRTATKTQATLDAIERQERLDKLFQPKHFRRVSSLYFDLRYVSTGDPDFQLDDADADTLAESLTMMAQTLFEIDPKYLACFMFCATFASVASKKEAQHRRNVASGKVPGKRPAARPVAPDPRPTPTIPVVV